MPDLESDEPVEQNKKQRGQGLKLLTPDQMLSRITIHFSLIKSRKQF